MDAGGVDGFAHEASEGIDLADEMTLRCPAEAGLQGICPTVSGDSVHKADSAAQAHRGMRGFTAGVSGPDDDDVRVTSDAEPGENLSQDVFRGPLPHYLIERPRMLLQHGQDDFLAGAAFRLLPGLPQMGSTRSEQLRDGGR